MHLGHHPLTTRQHSSRALGSTPHLLPPQQQQRHLAQSSRFRSRPQQRSVLRASSSDTSSSSPPASSSSAPASDQSSSAPASTSSSSSSQASDSTAPPHAAAATPAVSSKLTTDWEARRKQRVVNDLVDVSSLGDRGRQRVQGAGCRVCCLSPPPIGPHPSPPPWHPLPPSPPSKPQALQACPLKCCPEGNSATTHPAPGRTRACGASQKCFPRWLANGRPRHADIVEVVAGICVSATATRSACLGSAQATRGGVGHQVLKLGCWPEMPRLFAAVGPRHAWPCSG